MVITLHNARPVGIALHYTVLGGIYDQVVGKQVLKSVDRIISVSRWGVRGRLKIRNPQVQVHRDPRNGVDAGDFRPCSDPLEARRNPVRRRLGIGTGPVLLFVGRVIRQKGLDFAIAAMPAIIRRHPDAKLVIVGKGDKLEELKNLVERLGVGGSVVFTGFVDDSQLKALLSSADMFILPSLWEVLPVAILEAMAAGKAIVCTDAGGNRELVDGRNGIVVPKRNPKALARAVNALLATCPACRGWESRAATG